MSERIKRRILVVGGNNRRNVPPWLRAAFEVVHFESDESEGSTPDTGAIDAVIVLSSWVSHKHFFDARTIAEKSKAPLILSPGGWSAAVQYAAENGIEWFLKEIEASKSGAEPEASTEIDEVVENAWREAYTREWTARCELEKRYAKDRAKFDGAMSRVAKAARKEAAADRVIQEVREAAKKQRDYLDHCTQEAREIADAIKERNARLTQCLTDHFTQLRTLLEKASVSEQLLIQTAALLGETKRSIEGSMQALELSLAQSEAAASQTIAAPSVTQEAVSS